MQKRIFTYNNQKEFASFSGDCNPIHLDKKNSIKTHAGQPIVHGVHLVLWALDVFKIKIRIDTLIDATFKSQVNLNEDILAEHDKTKNQILIMSNNKMKIFSNIKLRNIVTSKSFKPRNNKIQYKENNFEPDNMEISKIALSERSYDLYGGNNKELGKSLFPFLVKDIGLNIVYELACLSSVVGMKVPGKHSLFAGLNLSFSCAENHKNYFVVDSKHEVLKVISISYIGVNLNASIKALFRPKPTFIKNVDTLKLEYQERIPLQGKKILVIGGSRGIGAYVTKLCSIMGADVTFTFNSNEEDANTISKEIIENGGSIEQYKLNVSDEDFITKIDDAFDDVYYFATPKILSNKSEHIDMDMIKKYRLFYVDSFKRLVDKCLLENSNTKFLYPSTIYLNENRSDYKEYISSKLEGENLCKLYNKTINGQILFPRLPQLDTDQNLSLRPTKNKKTSDYAFKMICMMSEDLIN